MRIKFLTTAAGAAAVHRVGDVVDIPEDAARPFIERGCAVPAVDAEDDAVTVERARRKGLEPTFVSPAAIWIT